MIIFTRETTMITKTVKKTPIIWIPEQITIKVKKIYPPKAVEIIKSKLIKKIKKVVLMIITIPAPHQIAYAYKCR